MRASGRFMNAGPSALMMAAVKGFRGVVQLLLNAKAEVDYAPTVDKQQISVVGGKQGPRGLNRKKSYGPATTGATALWIAARAGQLQSVKELIAGRLNFMYLRYSQPLEFDYLM